MISPEVRRLQAIKVKIEVQYKQVEITEQFLVCSNYDTATVNTLISGLCRCQNRIFRTLNKTEVN